jgi:hypothetical protein
MDSNKFHGASKPALSHRGEEPARRPHGSDDDASVQKTNSADSQKRSVSVAKPRVR